MVAFGLQISSDRRVTGASELRLALLTKPVISALLLTEKHTRKHPPENTHVRVALCNLLSVPAALTDSQQ